MQALFSAILDHLTSAGGFADLLLVAGVVWQTRQLGLEREERIQDRKEHLDALRGTTTALNDISRVLVQITERVR